MDKQYLLSHSPQPFSGEPPLPASYDSGGLPMQRP